MKALYQFALLASFVPTVSFAGVLNGGGGGKAVVCNLSGKTTVQVLDLYEAENVYRLKEAPRQTDLHSEFAFAYERLFLIWADPGQSKPEAPSAESVDKFLKDEFFSKVFYIPAGRRLPLTDDATVPVVPVGCEVAQVIVYSDLGIEVDRDYWDRMDTRNQAALIFHELLYLLRRDYGATNSNEVRRFVGRLYSTNPPTPRFVDAPKTGFYRCYGGGSNGQPSFSFAVYPGVEDGRAGTMISFSQLGGATTLGRTTSFALDTDLVRILGNPHGGFTASADIHSETTRETRSFNIRKEAGENPNILVWISDTLGNETKPTSVFCQLK